MNSLINTSQPARIIILGSGTCIPNIRRSACSVFIEIGFNKLLFDIGPGTMKRLLEAGLILSDITHIFLSHFHPDHSGELATFLFASKYGRFSRKKPLAIIAGHGLIGFYNALKKVYGHWIEWDPLDMLLNELPIKDQPPLKYDNFQVSVLPMCHNEESLAYNIKTSKGVSIVYTGDTDYCDNLITISKNADIMICESAFPDALKVKGHLTPSLAGKAAQKAGVKKLILTHFYPECDQVDIQKECQKAFNGPIVIAEDLMCIDL